MFIFIIIGGVAILLSGAFLGSGLDGDAFRANFFSETKEHRNIRTKMAFWTGGIGVVSFLIAGILYFL